MDTEYRKRNGPIEYLMAGFIIVTMVTLIVIVGSLLVGGGEYDFNCEGTTGVYVAKNNEALQILKDDPKCSAVAK